MSVHRSWPTLALLLLLPAGALSAQRVAADISIGHGPIAGRVIVGDPYPHYPRTVVEVRPRYRPSYREVVVIQHHRGHGWYRKHGYRTVRIWYDADRHSYYDRYDRNHPGLREVVVYERGGRYYRDDRRGGYERNDRYDRDDRDDRDDWSDRRNDDDRWDRDD